MSASDRQAVDRDFVIGLGRAYAGALIFAIPMIMTMEMWALGFYADSGRLALLMILTLPLLVGLSRFAGFRHTTCLLDDVVDAFVSIFVAATAAIVLLLLFSLLSPEMSTREIVGKIAIQIVPGSIGAMLARSQLGERSDDDDVERQDASYGGELFLMAAGALFLSFNLAPTEEIILIAYQMSIAQEVVLMVLSLGLMHGFVYAVNFRGGGAHRSDEPFISLFARYTVVGYAIVLLVSAYILWTFGRTDDASLQEIISTSVVMGFPAAIGAAAARLVL